MGSVPVLYTTGDNDPEIEPESCYRHYLYCDACGEFDLKPWTTPETPRDLGPPRRRLGVAAALAAALALVAAWEVLGLFPAPAYFVLVATGITAVLVFWGAWRLRTLRRFLLVLVVAASAQWVVTELPFAPVAVLAAAIALTLALLVWSALLQPLDEVHGLRCAGCGAEYPHGSDLFKDLDANPRNLTADDVPRPRGSLPFEVGASAPTPAAEPSRGHLPP